MESEDTNSTSFTIYKVMINDIVTTLADQIANFNNMHELMNWNQT